MEKQRICNIVELEFMNEICPRALRLLDYIAPTLYLRATLNLWIFIAVQLGDQLFGTSISLRILSHIVIWHSIRDNVIMSYQREIYAFWSTYNSILFLKELTFSVS